MTAPDHPDRYPQVIRLGVEGRIVLVVLELVSVSMMHSGFDHDLHMFGHCDRKVGD